MVIRDVRNKMVICLVGVVALLTAGCAEQVGRGEATNENAIAAYASLGSDPNVTTDLIWSLTMAEPGEPADLSGFLRGLRSASVARELGSSLM